MIKNFKNANVWGASVKHRPQKVSHKHTAYPMLWSAVEAVMILFLFFELQELWVTILAMCNLKVWMISYCLRDTGGVC